MEEAGTQPWLPAYGYQHAAIADNDGGGQHFLFLETIVEETSDDLRSESDRSGAAGWPDTDSDAGSVIHVTAGQWSGSDRELAVPKKRPRRAGGEQEEEEEEEAASLSSRSSSLLQFECLERHCEDVFRTTATAASPTAFSLDSLEGAGWRLCHSPDSLDGASSDEGAGASSDDTMQASTWWPHGGGGRLRSYRSFDSLHLLQQQQQQQQQQMSMRVASSCSMGERGASAHDAPLLSSKQSGSDATIVDDDDANNDDCRESIVVVSGSLDVAGKKSAGNAEKNTNGDDDDDDGGKKAEKKPQRSAENLSEDSGFGDSNRGVPAAAMEDEDSCSSYYTDCSASSSSGAGEEEEERRRKRRRRRRKKRSSEEELKLSCEVGLGVWSEPPSMFSSSSCWQSAPCVLATATAAQGLHTMATRLPVASTPDLSCRSGGGLCPAASTMSVPLNDDMAMYLEDEDGPCMLSKSLSGKGVHFCPVVSEVSWRDAYSDDDDEEDEEDEVMGRDMVQELEAAEDEEERGGGASERCVEEKERGSGEEVRSAVSAEPMERPAQEEQCSRKKAGLAAFLHRFSLRRLGGRSGVPAPKDGAKKKKKKKEEEEEEREKQVKSEEKEKEKEYEEVTIIPLHPTAPDSPVVRKPPLPPSASSASAPRPRGVGVGVGVMASAATRPCKRLSGGMAAARPTSMDPSRGTLLLETDLDTAITTTASPRPRGGGGGGGVPAPGDAKKARSLQSLSSSSSSSSLLNHHRHHHHHHYHHHYHHHRDHQHADGQEADDTAAASTHAHHYHPSNTADARAKSMEFLLDKDNQAAVKPPENELQKAGAGAGAMSEHQLRVQRSLQKLHVPDWYRKSSVSREPEGFLLRRGGGGRDGWPGLSSKTTSLSSLGSSQSAAVRSPSSHLLSPSPSPTPHSFTRWSTSRLHSSPPSASTSPCGSTRSSFNYRQPYLGWRSQERLARPRTPAERLAAGLLPPPAPAPAATPSLAEVRTSIKEVTSAIVHYVSAARDDGPRPRLCWLESSFVGSRPLDSPETPLGVGGLHVPRTRDGTQP